MLNEISSEFIFSILCNKYYGNEDASIFEEILSTFIFAFQWKIKSGYLRGYPVIAKRNVIPIWCIFIILSLRVAES